MSGILKELLCARCGHPADLHPVQGMGGTCMHRRDGDCPCPLLWERIEDRAIQRMSAGLAINTESDPDAEARERAAVPGGKENTE